MSSQFVCDSRNGRNRRNTLAVSGAEEDVLQVVMFVVMLVVVWAYEFKDDEDPVISDSFEEVDSSESDSFSSLEGDMVGNCDDQGLRIQEHPIRTFKFSADAGLNVPFIFIDVLQRQLLG